MFLHSLKITVLFVILAVGLELILGMILALLLEKNTPLFNFLRGFILLPMMLTPIVVGLLWKFIYDASFGILNYFIKIVFGKGLLFIGSYEQALLSVILVDVWQWTPFVFLILSAGLKTLDHELYEAASIDGASKVQQFFYLTIPLIKNVITIAVLFRVIDALRIFDIVYAMTGGGPADATMFLALYNYRIGFKFFNLGYGSSIAIIQVIMLAIVLVLMTKILKIEL
jgi:multiple sugar transport system permease protein